MLFNKLWQLSSKGILKNVLITMFIIIGFILGKVDMRFKSKKQIKKKWKELKLVLI